MSRVTHRMADPAAERSDVSRTDAALARREALEGTGATRGGEAGPYATGEADGSSLHDG